MATDALPRWVQADLLDRFERYVRVHTTSDHDGTPSPSTERQFELARILTGELRALGVDDVHLTEHCFVVARIPGTDPSVPPFALFAHLDTAPDFSGEGVRPIVHRDYDGAPIELGAGRRLSPTEYPELSEFVGDTIVTGDGTTLLGADDKAGVAEIMTFVRLLLEERPPHGPIEVVFTPDEEIGHGVDLLPRDLLSSAAAYTVDGGREGSIEAECFSAYRVQVDIAGYAIHPGYARGRMVNAVTVASRLLTMLPQNESPEATDGRYGFYCPTSMSGDPSAAKVVMIVRDFDAAEVERRVAAVRAIAAALEAAYPRATLTVTAEEQYRNMRDGIAAHPHVLELLCDAVQAAGVEPRMDPIRGGTDGSRLTAMGIPTPNLFTGGFNFHGPYEWIPLSSMEKAVAVLRELAMRWRAHHAS